jgi:hypothetical protein
MTRWENRDKKLQKRKKRMKLSGAGLRNVKNIQIERAEKIKERDGRSG